MTMIDQPVNPGVGPEGLPTPSLPDGEPAAPGPGPVELPTPSLPSQPSVPQNRVCPAGSSLAAVRGAQTFTDLLLENNVSYQALRSANPNLSTTVIPSGTLYCVPPSGSRRLCPSGSSSYVLGQGESLATLVETEGFSAGALLITNPMLAPGDFIPGRVVCLP